MTANLTVSDHAALRYLERVQGLDVEAIKGKIAEIVAAAHAAGARRISHDGMTFCLRGDVVTTITPGASPHSAFLKTQKHKGRSVRMREGRG